MSQQHSSGETGTRTTPRAIHAWIPKSPLPRTAEEGDYFGV
jgi:hypothetical protein